MTSSRSAACAAAILSCMFSAASAARPPAFEKGVSTFYGDEVKVSAPSAQTGPFEKFGTAVAISGDLAIVGAVGAETVSGAIDFAGAAFVLAFTDGQWVVEQRLIAPDRAASDFFGTSVAIDGNTVVIGAPGDGLVSDGADEGSGYVFVRTNGIWSYEAKLIASDPAGGDNCGESVAIEGNVALLGCPLDDVSDLVAGMLFNAGSARTFVRTGATWAQTAEIPGKANGEYAGGSVALSGSTAILGGIFGETAAGKTGVVYVVENPTAPTAVQRVEPVNVAVGAQFGISVDIDGDIAVAGAFLDDEAGQADAGSALVLERGALGWEVIQRLTASDGEAGDFFGRDVSVSAGIVLIGADQDDHSGRDRAGSAYEFQSVDAVWTQVQRLVAAAPTDIAGYSAGISQDSGRAIIGSPFADFGNRGAVFFYTQVALPPPPIDIFDDGFE